MIETLNREFFCVSTPAAQYSNRSAEHEPLRAEQQERAERG